MEKLRKPLESILFVSWCTPDDHCNIQISQQCESCRGMWEQQSKPSDLGWTGLHPDLGAARLGLDLPGPARILMLDCLYTVIFERGAVRALQKNAPVFEVLAIETLLRDSASPEDRSHVGALQVLVTALRSKRPSRGHFLRADAVLAVGRSRCEGQEGRTYWEVRVILPLSTHLQARSNSPSAFLVCRVRDLLNSEAGGDALSSCSFTSCRRDSRRRCCRHDSRLRSWTSEFLERTEEETETTTPWTTSFTTLDQ